MDFEGNQKELSNTNNKDFAIQFLSPTLSYIVIKIEHDPLTNEKKFTPFVNENRINANMMSKLFFKYIYLPRQDERFIYLYILNLDD